MRQLFSILIIVSTLTTAACTGKLTRPSEAVAELPSQTQYPTPPPATEIKPLKPLDLKRDAALEKEIEKLTENAKGRVGVAALVIETGEAALLNANDSFPMQSVYKLPISMAVLYAEEQGKLSLDEKVAVTKEDFVRLGVRSPLRDQFPEGGEFTIRELIGMSMTESDGTASDVLLDAAGGPAGVDDYLRRIGIKDMHVADSEKDIFKDWETQYRNDSTPISMTELFRALHEGAGISPENRQQLRYFMVNTSPGSRRIKKLLPEEVEVAHKTGTGGNKGGISSATNDAGIIYLPNGKHLAITVYIADSSADAATREEIIAKIAKAAFDRWSA